MTLSVLAKKEKSDRPGPGKLLLMDQQTDGQASSSKLTLTFLKSGTFL